MNNVHSLYPAKLESYDILGNQYTLHLQGMSPVGITTLGELPNIVIHDAATHFYFFLRIEWKNIEVARNSFAGQNLTALSRDYVKHLAEQVVEAGISLPAGARMEDVDNLIATVRDIGVTHQFGWLFRGLSNSFVFEIGAVFLQICKREPGAYTIPMIVNGESGYTLEFFVGPQRFRLNPATLFGEDREKIYQELEDWCHTAIGRSEFVDASFVISR